MTKPIDIKKISFDELRNLFNRKIFAIPEIQREFVWTKGKIISLLDSIKKHYPIGSFLVCKVNTDKVKDIRESTVLPAFDKHKNKECYVVVDGQQRLSVLYSILFERVITESRRYQSGIDFKQICVSPTSRKETEFDFYNTDKTKHMKLSSILNPSFSTRSLKRTVREKIKKCKDSFRTYSFPFIFISKYNEKNMREAFIRLNKGGTSLSSEDSIFALSYHKETDFRRHCEQALHGLGNGFDSIDQIHYITAMFACLGVKDFVGSSSRKQAARKIGNPRNQLHLDYKNKQHAIFGSIKSSVDYFVGKYKHASYLPYPSMISMLAIFFYNNRNRLPDDNQLKQIERWFWVTGFTGRYSGSDQRNNQLNDAMEMERLAKRRNYNIDLEGKAGIKPLSMNKLINNTRYNTSSALRNTFFCYLISKKPLNFTNSEPLEIFGSAAIFNSKNDHHIFPKKRLKRYYYKDYINSIMNICLLTFSENLEIRDAPPWKYLARYANKRDFSEILRSHCLPNDDCLLRKGKISEKYDSFVEQRTKLIKSDLYRMVGKDYIGR